MSMMDIEALMGGGGMGPGGPPPAPGGGMGGPPPAPPMGGGGEGGGEGELLPEVQDVLNLIQEMLMETQDPEEQAALSAAETALTKLVLNLQKQKDAAMGTTPAHKYVARQQGAGGGGA